MATPNIKNQNTLFRFVSLRNPELTKEKDIEKRFVFHPEKMRSKFFEAMAGREASQLKWQVMQAVCANFIALQTEAEVKELVGNDICALSDFIASNRSNTDSSELTNMASGIQPLDGNIIFTLWDNLFYQVVTQKSFYVKELIMQVLIANNLLTYQEIFCKGTSAIVAENYSILANARVVLPALLFEQATTAKRPIKGKSSTSNKENDAKQESLSDANNLILALETAKAAIQKQVKQYQKEYDKNYKNELSKYEAEIAPIIENYNKQLAAEKAEINRNAVESNASSISLEPTTPFPTLPKFDFRFPPPIDSLSELLPAESFNTLQTIDALKNADNYSEIIENIEAEIANQYAVVTANTTFSEPILLVNGMAISLSESKILPYDPSVIEDGAFVPEKFGVRQIGIADYKKVVAHVCCYDAGEVSHIENIMAREMRSKSTTRERIEENTETTETSQERESLTDTATSERFEMQTEVSKLLQEQKQFEAHASVNGHFGTTSFEVGANYATNTSKEESNRQAVTQAKDITQKASERIVTKMRNEIVRKTTERFKEENDHVFDNRLGDKHVAGVYRFINAVYKNQVYNYGKRMMYEFMIPQPSKLHVLGLKDTSTNTVATTIVEKPIDPRTIGLISASYINEYNFNSWSAMYGASADALPSREIFVGKSFSYNNNTVPTAFSQAASVEIPENYLSNNAQINFTGMSGWAGWDNKVIASVGNVSRISNPSRIELTEFFEIKKYKSSVPVSVSATSFFTCTITINVGCLLTDEAYKKWQQDTFDAIIKAYDNKLASYNNAFAQNNTETNFSTNPGFYRQTENLVLRKNCISYLMDEAQMGQGFYNGSSLKTYSLQQTQDMDNYASHAKFMEQAFEWNLISYNFYPFYWGKREDWPSLYQFECNDPLFRSFMQAGMARVVVTVKPGFENAVMHFMATGQIWNGGQVPVLDNPLYLSIVDELKEQEYVIEESWETIVPTSLVALQSSGVAINAEGLPCGDDCIDHAAGTLINNNNTISGK